MSATQLESIENQIQQLAPADFCGHERGQTRRVVRSLAALPDKQRNAMDAEFREISDRRCDPAK
ncbi:MAG: hypothetical protein HQL49_02795 [Gammaproteobacteria bacterium]|nr:hypothetical protein [Gammaproteobacteria bacterium]